MSGPFIYNLNIPFQTNDPGDDQPNMQTNTNSINSWINVDHSGFAGTPPGTSGYHNVIHFVDQGSTTPGVITGVGQLYTNTVDGDQQLFYESGEEVVTQLTNAHGVAGAPTILTGSYTPPNSTNPSNQTSITTLPANIYGIVMFWDGGSNIGSGVFFSGSNRVRGWSNRMVQNSSSNDRVVELINNPGTNDLKLYAVNGNVQSAKAYTYELLYWYQ